MLARSARFALALLVGSGLAACDQSTEPGKVDASVSPTLKVNYQGTDQDVDLTTLKSTVTPTGAAAVLLSDVVLKALPGKDLATLKANFRAADGYDPSTKSTCTGVTPVAGEKLNKGFVELATHNLTWAADLQLPGCVHVKNLAQVLLLDVSSGSDRGADRAPDRGVVDSRSPDLAPAGAQVKVTYQGADTLVDVTKLAKTATDAGVTFVLASEVVLKALPGKDLSTLNAGFRGTDGYDPATKSNCNGFVPVSGDKLTKGYLSPTSLTLSWDASLAFPGCLKIASLGQILLADK